VSRRLPVVLNPIAGGGRLLRRRPHLDSAAQALGIELAWWPTERPGHAEELARRAVAEGRSLVLAYGGDGTYNEVARGLVGSSTALGVLPGGTTSVLAYEFSVPRPAERALAAVVAGRDRPMRVGRTGAGELFLLMLSAGPDAVVLDNLLPSLKRLGGRVGVAVQAVIELLRWRRLPRLRVAHDGVVVDGGWAIVGNSRCYGGPYPATPGADPFAATLELVLQQRVGRRAAAGFALGIPSGRHVRRPDVLQERLDRLRLEAAPGSEPVPYQLDGDLAGHLPVEAWVDPEALLVRLPGGLKVKG
jgi:diacylglycerol kinase family enzyme